MSGLANTCGAELSERVAATPLSPGLERGPEGHAVGKNPSKLSAAELALAGHKPQPVLSAIRAKCLDCCAGSPLEIRLCPSVGCPLWPYRMATNPLRIQREISDEQRDVLRSRLATARNANASGSDQPCVEEESQ